MLDRLSKKLGFTLTELKVVFFLTLTLVAGFSYKNLIKDNSAEIFNEDFDYSMQDSLFLNPPGDGLPDSAVINVKKEVDYKQEVLDFNNRSFKKYTKKTLPAENSININNAEIDELTALPGIGKKTAQSILDFRIKNGKFNQVSDLLKIKGIGQTKLNNIKKYIYIE
ncbi:MAG: helix-hairpin-helix domain-containing protein [Ignavibacteriaceae bacterium]